MTIRKLKDIVLKDTFILPSFGHSSLVSSDPLLRYPPDSLESSSFAAGAAAVHALPDHFPADGDGFSGCVPGESHFFLSFFAVSHISPYAFSVFSLMTCQIATVLK